MPENKNAYDILREREFIEQTTDEKQIRHLLAKQKVTFYVGFDPSASSLHVGSLEQLMAMMHLKNYGHRPIALIGGGTGLIGDPSDKDKARPLLSLARVKGNVAALEKQIQQILKSDKQQVLFLNNSDWLKKVNYIDFLRDIGRHFSVNRLLTIEWIKNRLKTGLSFLEFNYQLLQAYDFWYLFKHYHCLLQLGGSDQWGNIVAGIELIRRIEGKEAYGITLPLLTTSGGKKMGKTEKGAVWLDAELTSPYEYYQFWINIDDKDTKRFLLLFTFLPTEEIKKISRLKGAETRKAKEMLAYEATKIIHGETEAEKARNASLSLFQKSGARSDSIPTTLLDKKKLKDGIPIFKLFTTAGLCGSSSEAQRLIMQGGAYLNGKRLTKFNLRITGDDFKDGEILLQAGKKKYRRLKLH